MKNERNRLTITVKFGDKIAYEESSENELDIDAIYLLMPEMLKHVKSWLSELIKRRIEDIQSSSYNYEQTELPGDE